MNHGFKSRFGQMRENDPSRSNSSLATPDEIEQYSYGGNVRNVCFVWPDGRRLFLNYAYLIAGGYDPHGEMNQIKLTFSSQTILLNGYHFDGLFMALLDHLPRLLVATNPRYHQMAENDLAEPNDNHKAIILEIIVESNNA